MLPLMAVIDLLLILLVILISMGMFFAIILEANPNADLAEQLSLAPL